MDQCYLTHGPLSLSAAVRTATTIYVHVCTWYGSARIQTAVRRSSWRHTYENLPYIRRRGSNPQRDRKGIKSGLARINPLSHHGSEQNEVMIPFLMCITTRPPKNDAYNHSCWPTTIIHIQQHCLFPFDMGQLRHVVHYYKAPTMLRYKLWNSTYCFFTDIHSTIYNWIQC
jgi:hypothetical protein